MRISLHDDLNRNTQTSYSDGTPAVTRRYDPAVAYGKGQLWQTETANTAQVTASGFDALGRPATLQQKFWQTGLSDWNAAPAYTVSREYNLATLKKQTYPSGHTVNYEYDDAGRLADKNAAETAFRGNLGDGVTRSYAKELQYGVYGLEQETYGLVTPLYHRMSYNKRGQMTDMQLGSGAGADAYNRGRIQNFYAGNAATPLTEGANNNGNLLAQDNSIPNYTGATGPTTFRQVYDYDSLNRLKGASEYYNGGAQAQWRQQFDYDRWGNRTINQAATTNGIPKPDFACDTTNNRLLPGPTMPGADGLRPCRQFNERHRHRQRRARV